MKNVIKELIIILAIAALSALMYNTICVINDATLRGKVIYDVLVSAWLGTLILEGYRIKAFVMEVKEASEKLKKKP